MKPSTLFPLSLPLALAMGLLIFALFSLLSLSRAFEISDWRLYDLLLRSAGDVEEDDSILIINIDDPSLALEGAWPWNRARTAEGVLRLKELGAESIFLDIEYNTPSDRSGNFDAYRRRLEEELRLGFESYLGRAAQFGELLSSGAVLPAESPLLFEELAGLGAETEGRLLDLIGSNDYAADNVLGRSLSAAGMVSVPIILRPGEEPAEFSREEREWLTTLPKAGGEKLPQAGFEGFPIPPVAEGAARLGTTTIPVDPDGSTRSLHLFYRVGDAAVPQFILPEFMEQRGKGALRLEQRELGLGDLTIPRLPDGRVLLRFPKGEFLETFRHLSYAELLRLEMLEEELIAAIRLMEEAGYGAYADGELSPGEALQLARSAEESAVSRGSASLYDEYLRLKEVFLGVTGAFLNGGAEELIAADLQELIDSLPEENPARSEYTALSREVGETFTAARTLHRDYLELRERLIDEIENARVFIGYTATNTTDFSLTPFDERYINVGLHAVLENMLTLELFIRPVHPAIPYAAAFFLSLGLAFGLRNRKPLQAVLIGLGILLLTGLLIWYLFRFQGIYLPALLPLGTTAVSFLLITLLSYVATEREKSWLYSAFQHYISAEFIDELVKDPKKLNLGGEEKHLTALFTDVKDFTTVAESLSATDLVALLNRYLTQVSTTILEEGGTIDKYEGDAVVAFFGAPIEAEDQESAACRTALRIKLAEEELNRIIAEKGLSPLPLKTRIGINSGPMVVGNLGTDRRMNYTILGHEANIASRLEGVNKHYGSWILASGATRAAAGDDLLFRELDTIRVAGARQPVVIYELVGYNAGTPPLLKESLEFYARGLALYRAGDYRKADEAFANVMRLYPDDGPARRMRLRCRQFIQKGVPQDWDGIYSFKRK